MTRFDRLLIATVYTSVGETNSLCVYLFVQDILIESDTVLVWIRTLFVADDVWPVWIRVITDLAIINVDN